ncbi:organic cation transporter protein [Procambarus clarkii]|uniref:organic cation transporter protein n=1 Tax=Procambarus clarkii TaxID=6728 RepID=UPI001E67089B|nr:organic cation transporter protein-like [Procambarus clarkii]
MDSGNLERGERRNLILTSSGDKTLDEVAKKIHSSHDEEENFQLSPQDSGGGFDEALELAGSWGTWQKLVFVIADFSQIFCGMHAVSSVYLSYTPEHWCRVPGLNDAVGDLWNASLPLLNVSSPWSDKTGYDKCQYYDHNYTAVMPDLVGGEGAAARHLATNVPTVACDSWVFDPSVFQSTLVSEFSLVCSRRWMMATVQASYMSGLLVGSLVMGQLSDRYGRRPMSVLCAVAAALAGTVVSFAKTYMQFLVLRFVTAILSAGLIVINFVLVMEVVKPEARTMTGMMYIFFVGLGTAILPGMAYFIRSWRYLELAIGLSSFILVAYYWILPESPRWLASQGRFPEALKILKNIARRNGKELPSDELVLKLISRAYTKADEATATQSSKWYSGIVNAMRAQFTLVRTPVMRRRCMISFFLWFVSASVYYGLIFSGANIKADPFLMIFISGLVELPSAIVFISPLDKFGRRATMSGLFIASSACLLAILAVPQDQIYVNFFLVSFGKFFTTAVFQQQYLYTGELMPTKVRNIAVGSSSMMARIGCIITPYIITLLGDVHYVLPSTLFGILSLVAGLLTLLLPETNHMPLPETVEEVEAMSK